jgi:hypothetical protein
MKLLLGPSYGIVLGDIINEIQRHKAYSGKINKSAGGLQNKTAGAAPARKQAVAVTPTTTKGKKDRSPSKSPPSSRPASPSTSRGRKVTSGTGDMVICISDLAKHFNVKSNLEPCKSGCPYVHNNQLPSTLKVASALAKV